MPELISCVAAAMILASILVALTRDKRKTTHQASSSPMDDLYRDPVGVALDDDHPAQIAAQVLLMDVMDPDWESDSFGDE